MSADAERPGGADDDNLRRHLRELRLAVDRKRVGLPHSRRRLGATQQEVLALLGNPVGERQWRNLERCEAPWPRHIADAYADLLGLAGRDRRVFYTVVGHRRAARDASTELSDAERFMLSRAFARCTPWYVCDELWDIRACNAAMSALVPQVVPGMNMVEFVLAHPVAQSALVDWYEAWATPMVHQVRSTTAGSGGERRAGLEAVARTCLAENPRLAPLFAQDHLDVRLSPNGDRRRLRPADPDSPDGLGAAQEVLLYGMAPLNRPDWRAMWLFPVDHACELCRGSDYDDGERWFR